jgi:preprotein translocase subunit YajC
MGPRGAFVLACIVVFAPVAIFDYFHHPDMSDDRETVDTLQNLIEAAPVHCMGGVYKVTVVSESTVDVTCAQESDRVRVDFKARTVTQIN